MEKWGSLRSGLEKVTYGMVFDLIVFTYSTFFFLLLGALIYKRSPKSFMLLYFLISLAVLLVHLYSLSMDRNGYSPFVKERMLDDEIYHHKAKFIVENGVLLDVLLMNTDMYEASFLAYLSSEADITNDPETSIIYPVILSLVYYLLGPYIIASKLFVGFLSAICILITFSILQKLTERGRAKYLTLILALNPSFFLYSVQLVKDIPILFLILFLLRYTLGHIEFSFKVLLGLLIISTLRYQASITFIYLLLVNKFRSFSIKVAFIYLIIPLFPMLILIIKYTIPPVYDYIIFYKSWQDFMGVKQELVVDYSTYTKGFSAVIENLFSFLTLPLHPTVVREGNLLWRLMMFEPIIYVLLPCWYIFRQKKYHLYKSKEVLILIAFVLFYSLLTSMFENHVGALLRKRLPICFVMYFIMAIFLKKTASNINP